MPFRCPEQFARGLVLAGVLALVSACDRVGAAPPPVQAFRVCADPKNLPYSNRAAEGFENRIAELVARDLGRRVEYTWWPQRRGFVRNTLGADACDASEPNPPARIVDAVADGSIDLAILWGPFAGYFAPRAAVPLQIRQVPSDPADAPQRFTYPMSMGVRRGDTALKDRLDEILTRRAAEIRRILEDYGVPLAAPPKGSSPGVRTRRPAEAWRRIVALDAAARDAPSLEPRRRPTRT